MGAAPTLSATPFALLRLHAAIGWDFDGTLHDHPASGKLHAFILAHPHIRHVIVTFRSRGEQNFVWDDLAEYPDAPDPTYFAGLVNIPDAAEIGFDIAISRHSGRHNHRRRLTPAEILYLEWKGSVCAKLGLTVLIDDMTDLVQRGCLKHGIELFHPDEFLRGRTRKLRTL